MDPNKTVLILIRQGRSPASPYGVYAYDHAFKSLLDLFRGQAFFISGSHASMGHRILDHVRFFCFLMNNMMYMKTCDYWSISHFWLFIICSMFLFWRFDCVFNLNLGIQSAILKLPTRNNKIVGSFLWLERLRSVVMICNC